MLPITVDGGLAPKHPWEAFQESQSDKIPPIVSHPNSSRERPGLAPAGRFQVFSPHTELPLLKHSVGAASSQDSENFTSRF